VRREKSPSYSLADDDGKISDEALNRYSTFYRDLLGRDHVEALSALFGWAVPSEENIRRDPALVSVYLYCLFLLLCGLVFFLVSMDRTSILIWNVRGLNDRARRDNLGKGLPVARMAVTRRR